MPGRRALEGGTFITPRAPYREDITTVDPSVEDTSIPILDTSKSPNEVVGLGQSDWAQYGQNGQMDLALIVEGFSSVTVQLWLQAEIEQRGLQPSAPASSSSSSSSSSYPTTGEWVYVGDKTVDKSTLWIVKDTPPGKYKVRVSAVSGSGSVRIRESHAA
jgi:hypothetical protein